MNDTGRDLLDIAKAQTPPSFEHDIATFMGEDASDSEDSLSSVGTLLEVFDAVSCNTDRAKIQPIIRSEITYLSNSINSRISNVSNGISRTSVPGTAITGARLRNELRAAKETLDVLGKSIQ